MKTIKIQLEYKCYPVWVYDEDGFVEEASLPLELAEDIGLHEKFKSIQDRFDATYVETSTEFYRQGFPSPAEEASFESDLAAAVAELAKKRPEGYLLEKSIETAG